MQAAPPVGARARQREEIVDAVVLVGPRRRRTLVHPCFLVWAAYLAVRRVTLAIPIEGRVDRLTFPRLFRPEEAADLLLELRDHGTVFRHLGRPLGAHLKPAIALAREVVFLAERAKASVTERQPENSRLLIRKALDHRGEQFVSDV